VFDSILPTKIYFEVITDNFTKIEISQIKKAIQENEWLFLFG